MAQPLEQAARPARASLRLRGPALLLLGLVLLLLGLALGGGPLLLTWLLGALMTWPFGALAVGALYVVPGLALLRVLPLPLRLHLAARLSLALCLSVALPPLLLLLARLAHLPWGAGATWVYLLLCSVVALWPDAGEAEEVGVSRVWFAGRHRLRQGARLDAPGAALLLLTLATLAVRMFVVRDLPTGLLGDSYHHTLIAQLLVDHGGLFDSWQPYAPLATLTYHYGFHANAAFVAWLTGITPVKSVLIVGQVLNTLVLPAIFVLTVALTGSGWAGVWAALITGFVSIHPGFYVNWGRYTQLTGEIVLVAAAVSWIALAERVRADELSEHVEVRARDAAPLLRRVARDAAPLLRRDGLLLAAIATAGLLVTHYLVSVFGALLVLSYLVLLALERRSGPFIARLAARVVPAALLAALLVTPWFLNVLRGYLVRNAVGFVNGGVSAARVAQYTALPPVLDYLSGPVLLAALLGLLLAGWRRDWRAALCGLWALLVALCATPQAVGLPGAGTIDGFTAFITLFLAVGPLAGYALAALQNGGAALLARRHAPAWAGAALLGAALFAIATAGVGPQSRVIDGSTQLVTQADMAAMDWVRANTPADALFLVNSIPAYGGTVVAGTDAGWWLPLLAGRQTNIPPITYGSEQPETRGYVSQVNKFVATLRAQKLSDARPVHVNPALDWIVAILRERGIDYVYCGAHSFPAERQADWFDRAAMRASPDFRLVYNQDGVEIFQLIAKP